MKIGNWLLDESGISWSGKNKKRYVISLDEIAATSNRGDVYDWLIHIPSKTWIKEVDIYALNTIFIYVLSRYEMDFNIQSFTKTLEEQQRILKEL